MQSHGRQGTSLDLSGFYDKSFVCPGLLSFTILKFHSKHFYTVTSSSNIPMQFISGKTGNESYYMESHAIFAILSMALIK